MRKNLLLGGVIAIVLGLVLVSFAAPLISGFTSADMRYAGNYYSSTPIQMASGDLLTIESHHQIYLVPYASLSNVSKSTISSLQVPATANTSIGGLTTKTWSGLNGSYSIVSFLVSSVNPAYSVITSSSQSRTYAYSIGAVVGAVLFVIGIVMIFAGLILKKKVQVTPPEASLSQQ